MTETDQNGVLARDTPFEMAKAVETPSVSTKSKASSLPIKSKAAKRKTRAKWFKREPKPSDSNLWT